MSVEQALLDPTSVYASPDEVVDDPSHSREQKIEILRRWEYDARELQVAEEENMAGGPSSTLDRVLTALARLGTGASSGHSSPTKHGGS